MCHGQEQLVWVMVTVQFPEPKSVQWLSNSVLKGPHLFLLVPSPKCSSSFEDAMCGTCLKVHKLLCVECLSNRQVENQTFSDTRPIPMTTLSISKDLAEDKTSAPASMRTDQNQYGCSVNKTSSAIAFAKCRLPERTHMP